MSRRKEKLEASLESLFSSAKRQVPPQKPALIPESPATPTPAPEGDELIEKSLPEKAVEMPVTVSEPQVKPVSPVEEEITPVVVTVTPAVTKPPEILTTQPTTTLTAPTPVKAQPAEVEAEHGITPIEFLATGNTQIIIFMLRGDYYGIDISNVHTIIKPQPACPVPHTADFLIGLINLRGQVVPVADLRKRLCFPAMESNKDTRVVIVSVRDELAGILVDAVVGVKTLPNDTIEPPSMIFTTTDINLLNGIAKSEGKLILLLDVVKVFIRKQIEKYSTDLVFS